MIKKAMLTLISLIVAAPLVAQKSEKAEKYINSRFTNTFDIWIARLSDIKDTADAKLVIRLDSLVSKSPSTDKRDVTNTLMQATKFNPFWDKENKLIRKILILSIERAEKIPAGSVEEWRLITDTDISTAALSLTVENELFSKERFSEEAFEAFIKKFR